MIFCFPDLISFHHYDCHSQSSWLSPERPASLCCYGSYTTGSPATCWPSTSHGLTTIRIFIMQVSFIPISIFIFIFGLTTIQILITTQVRLPIIAPTIAFFSPVLNANIECNQEMNREQTETGVSTFSTPLLTLTGSLFSFNNRVALLY